MHKNATLHFTPSPDFVPLNVPFVHGKEWEYVKDCLDQSCLSSDGEYVQKLEEMTSAHAGTRYGVAASSATTALQTALQVVGVEPGDEVLLSTLTSPRPALALKAIGANGVFMDADPTTFQIDTQKVKDFLERACQVRDGKTINRATGHRVRALLPVHALGHPVDLDPLLELANRFDLLVVEDASESLGAGYKDRPVGKTDWLACYSFDGNSLCASGNGGMIVTDNSAWATRAQDTIALTSDSQLSPLHAAIAVAQMERLAAHVEAKQRIAARYDHGLSSLPGIQLMSAAEWATSTFSIYTVLVEGSRHGMDSRTLSKYLQARRIQARQLGQPLHRCSEFAGWFATRCETAERLQREALCLPCSVGLTPYNQDRVMVILRETACQRAAA